MVRATWLEASRAFASWSPSQINGITHFKTSSLRVPASWSENALASRSTKFKFKHNSHAPRLFGAPTRSSPFICAVHHGAAAQREQSIIREGQQKKLDSDKDAIVDAVRAGKVAVGFSAGICDTFMQNAQLGTGCVEVHIRPTKSHHDNPCKTLCSGMRRLICCSFGRTPNCSWHSCCVQRPLCAAICLVALAAPSRGLTNFLIP